MPSIIKDRAIAKSEFTVTNAENASVDGSNAILPLAFYLEHRDKLIGRNDVGVWLEAGDEIEDIAAFANELPVVALNFPAFADGRAYSSASILKRTMQYQGEIRAIGDVRRDQLSQMVHCGFNAFELADGQDANKCLDALDSFSDNYQSTVATPEPLFRRR
ncbi:MAG: hypothetical protein ACJAYE_002807 [Candidatus Azotimanducaceae bacterium]|jgi:uncharacterized protein (DUF934 family)